MSGITKKEKRCKKFREEISPIYQEFVNEHFQKDGSKNASAFGGIVRDMVCFFIAETYGGNINFYRAYYIPTNFGLECLEKFKKDLETGKVTYSTIKDHYFRKQKKFKKMVEGVDIQGFEQNDSMNRVLVLCLKNKSFIRCERKNEIRYTKEENASAFDFFMTDEATKNAIEHYIGSRLGDVVIIHCAYPKLYHYPA